MKESWFVIVAVVMLTLSLAGAAVAVQETDADPTDEIAWSPPELPDDSDAPSEAGTATVDDESFDSVQTAVDAAEPGDEILLEGYFDERIVIETPNVTLRGVDGSTSAMIDGGGDDTVVTVLAENVTISDLWITESGHDRAGEDAGIMMNGSDSTVSDVRITAVTYGIWINGVSNVTVEETTIVGRLDVYPVVQRGNGIHLWSADDTVLRNNSITEVRDGIYYSWSEAVLTEGNAMWDVRYGVHYMYSQDNVLRNNVAAENDVGFALMVSSNLTVTDNLALNNRGQSSHGILLKDIDDSTVADNAIVNNGNGLYVYNAHGNAITDNLVLENDVGLFITAKSTVDRVVGNSFIYNGEAAFTTTRDRVAWNDSERGNFWSDARVVDRSGDGTSEIRYHPAGTVERLTYEQPQAAVFSESPAFDAVRMAESSFPVVEAQGIIDHRPLAEPEHEEWRQYYGNHDH